MDHILLDKAILFPTRKKPEVNEKNCTYDYERGFWVDENNQPAIFNKRYNLQIGTKKYDIETGEDHKGE